MLKRLTASALLKSVIALLAVCVVAVLATTAWDSAQRLRSTGRIAAIAEASANAFMAMHDLSNDRSATGRVVRQGHRQQGIEGMFRARHRAQTVRAAEAVGRVCGEGALGCRIRCRPVTATPAR